MEMPLEAPACGGNRFADVVPPWQVSKLDVALKVAQEGLQKVRNTSEDKVERSLMKTFFTQYLTAPGK